MRLYLTRSRGATWALAILLGAPALTGCGQKPEPTFEAAPVAFDPPSAGGSREGDVGTAAGRAAPIRPDITERPPEDIQPPGESDAEPQPEASSAAEAAEAASAPG